MSGDRFDPRTCDWNRHVFSLITPDSLHRGKLAAILDRLRSAGFRVEHGRLFGARSLDVDALYSDHIEMQWEIYRFRLVDRLVHFGRSLAVVLSHETLTGTEMYRHVTEVKGSSNPLKAQPGTIRHDLGAVNAIVGLLHVSDDPVEASREAGIFFLDFTGPVLDGDAVQAFAEVNRLTARYPAPSLDTIIARLRFEICLAAAPLVADDALARVLRLASEDFESLAAPSIGIQLANAMAAPAIGALDLRRWLAADFWPGAVGVPDVPSEAGQLAAVGISLTRWEQLVLETSTFFPSQTKHGREGIAP